MYKNIIFDLGNVLLNYNPVNYLNAKVEDNAKVLQLKEQIFDSNEWALLDRGTITEAEAIDAICSRYPENKALINLVFDNWYELLTPIEASIDILKALKENNYKIYFLSNFHLLAFENVCSRFDFFNLFDGGIVSYKEKYLKPEAEIYNCLINTYSLIPEESIFIDDMPDNIAGAKKLGFNTINFKDSKDLKENLLNLNIYM